jgi:hypothetical protein
VALEWVLFQIRSDVFAGNAERWGIGQPVESIVHPFQVMLSLFSSPPFFRELCNISQVRLGGVR